MNQQLLNCKSVYFTDVWKTKHLLTELQFLCSANVKTEHILRLYLLKQLE